MAKKATALLMAMLLALALAGCGENKANTNRPGSDSNNTTNNGTAKAFNDNHGSTFGGAGEDIKEDAQQFPPTVYDTMTGNRGASGTATWRQMLENGFVHDTDGFLLDGENSCWS